MTSCKEYDVVVIGAGFGGLHALRHLRKLGLSVRCLERGPRLGGVWHWNCYPGARVDSDLPVYQYSDKELWNGWTWSERFPGWAEIREYFKFVDKTWNLSKDVEFGTEVTSAAFDQGSNQWLITSSTGNQFKARWFIPALGFASKKYIPDIKGIDAFQGPIHHTAAWPQGGLDLAGKKVAIIGTGASGVQVIQEIASEVSQLHVYQRTPNLALPMRQAASDAAEEKQLKDEGTYEEVFRNIRESFSGFNYNFRQKNTLDDTPEEREALFNELYSKGGFRFWLATYQDMLYDREANNEAYLFWAKKTRARIQDPKRKDILAPLKAPHPFGTKRPCLEQNYYELYNQANVELTDINEDPIEEITENGIRTRSGETEFDVIILATGFDAMTGGLTNINIIGTDGRTIRDNWKDGVRSFLGIACHRFPNMFVMYGPQAPSLFSNGPTIDEVQSEWITQTLSDMISKRVVRIEAKQSSEQYWRELVAKHWDATLYPTTRSWYGGGNIPNKKVEALNWTGGLPAYISECKLGRANDYAAFICTTADQVKPSTTEQDALDFAHKLDVDLIRLKSNEKYATVRACELSNTDDSDTESSSVSIVDTVCV